MTFDDPQERSATAGEYVLGTLSADERAVFVERLVTDPALQAEVYAWQDQLLGLVAKVAPMAPDASTWSAIESRLTKTTQVHSSLPHPDAPSGPSEDATSTKRAHGQPPAVVGPLSATITSAQAANDAQAARRLRRWRATAGLLFAACVVLSTLLSTRGPEQSVPRYLTVLQAPDNSTGWVVEITEGQALKLRPVGPSAAVPSGKTLQFWTKIDGAAGPTSLGLVEPGKGLEVPLNRLPGVVENQLFELTLEPEAGSPIDRPTGPILYIGRSVRI